MRTLLFASLLLGFGAWPVAGENDPAEDAVLVNTAAEELGEIVKYEFLAADGKSPPRIVLPDVPRQSARRLPPGYWTILIRVWRQQSPIRKTTDWWAQAEVGASLQPGRRYEIRGRFVPQEAIGTYIIVDCETGDPVSEPVELMFVSGVAPRWKWIHKWPEQDTSDNSD